MSPAVPSWPAKSPADQVRCGLDFSRLLRRSAAIAAVEAFAIGCSVYVENWTAEAVGLLLTGGVNGATASVTVTVTTDERPSQRIRRVVSLPIIGASCPSPPSVAGLVTTNGSPVMTAGLPVTTFAPAASVVTTAGAEPMTNNMTITTGAANG